MNKMIGEIKLKTEIAEMTVIMPVYNRRDAVKNAIFSVLNQSFPDFELIIVDDCSTDGSWEFCNSINDRRIRTFKLPKNSGAAVARNFGISKSLGKYISFLDSDDTFEENFLKISKETLDDTAQKIGFMWTGRRIILNGKIHEEVWRPLGTSSYSIFLKNIRIGTGAGVTIKREVFEKCGNFDMTLPAAEDTDFFFRISQHFDFTYSEEILVNIYKNNIDRMSKNYKNQATAYNLFLTQHSTEIGKDPELERIYFYKLMWLNFHLNDKVKAKEYFRKIPRNSLKFSLKILFVYNIYFYLPLRIASYIHGKLAD
ncbi:glycosyltransferase family 2 protein [Gillisia sp. CAL575]|uniref:glycosyltransferase family 2 protein n=1 Tax=Gillisia sp. CAL575 TaxID=985255 RepID=UPI00039D27CB|nr:glycosyltransferase family 2 protein [Gillisia sp. CAL575]